MQYTQCEEWGVLRDTFPKITVNTKTVQLYIAMSLFICIKHEPGLKQGYMLESSMNQG